MRFGDNSGGLSCDSSSVILTVGYSGKTITFGPISLNGNGCAGSSICTGGGIDEDVVLGFGFVFLLDCLAGVLPLGADSRFFGGFFLVAVFVVAGGSFSFK